MDLYEKASIPDLHSKLKIPNIEVVIMQVGMAAL